ncbi:MAG: hypothetical protein M3P32_02750 [Chloroflexota bacterium]|nr:hypothetical protein [Chloroflexota bacterium]
MSEHPNAAAIRAQTEALNRGDTQTMAVSLADDVVWHEIGSPEHLVGPTTV